MKSNYTWLPADLPDSTVQLQIVSAKNSYLTTVDGREIFDGISSWWCKPLGHSHPLVINSITEQLKYFDHHIPAKASNAIIEELSTKLVHIFTQMDKVMYACDGSSAVEIAMKLSYETRVLNQQPQRFKYIALSGAYHGETIFTLGVCGIDGYKKNYHQLLQDNYFIQEIPYVSGKEDPKWANCNFDHNYWNDFFAKVSQSSTALIIEPMVQGAAGMKIISPDFLKKIISLAQQYDLHIIADEIMVGLGKLGCLSVSKEFLNIEPDLVCFAKNLTAGSIPMSAVVINKSISDVFRKHNQPFHHSHTHSCNALAASVACSYLDLLQSSSILMQVDHAEKQLVKIMREYQARFSFIECTRVIGSIAAMELHHDVIDKNNIFAMAIEENIYLRMIGNVLYIMPPIHNLINDLEYIFNQLAKLFGRISRSI